MGRLILTNWCKQSINKTAIRVGDGLPIQWKCPAGSSHGCQGRGTACFSANEGKGGVNGCHRVDGDSVPANDKESATRGVTISFATDNEAM